MVTIKDKHILFTLRGYASPEDQNKFATHSTKLEKPTAQEIQNFLQRLSPEQIREYGNGPWGSNFTSRANEALDEIREKAAKKRPRGSGRIGSTFLNFERDEVGH